MRQHKPRRISFKVTFDMPNGATVARATEYVLDAVASMKGALKPPGADPEDPDGDPMFELDGDTVRVVHLFTSPRPLARRRAFQPTGK